MRALVAAALLAALPTLAAAQDGEGADLLARNYEYVPTRLVVPPGATVSVLSQGEGHTMTDAEGDRFDTGLIQPGDTATFQAPDTPGEYKFYCALHARPTDPVDGDHMTGVLVVDAAATLSPEGPVVRDPGFEAALLVVALMVAAGLLGRRGS